jgi:hypothetical protein
VLEHPALAQTSQALKIERRNMSPKRLGRVRYTGQVVLEVSWPDWIFVQAPKVPVAKSYKAYALCHSLSAVIRQVTQKFDRAVYEIFIERRVLRWRMAAGHRAA